MEVADNDRLLFTNSVKAGGLGIRNPCHEAIALNTIYKVALSVLVKALVEGTELSLVGHRKSVKKARAMVQVSKKEEELITVVARKGQATAKEKKRLTRVSEYGAWLTRLPARIEGNQVTEGECHDNLSLRYGFMPIHLI